MIAPLRTSDEDNGFSLSEPRHIGELLSQVLAQRGIDLTYDRPANRRDCSAAERYDASNMAMAEAKF
jgi:hypothetical protein